MAQPHRGPGLAKARSLPVLERRETELWRGSDYRWRELFETADVMSEGATRVEADEPVYYGTTSILLPYSSRGGLLPDELGSRVLSAIRGDLHARLRVIRIACREGQVRAGARFKRVRAELLVRSDPSGVRVDVEVEARLDDDTRAVLAAKGARERRRRHAAFE